MLTDTAGNVAVWLPCASLVTVVVARLPAGVCPTESVASGAGQAAGCVVRRIAATVRPAAEKCSVQRLG